MVPLPERMMMVDAREPGGPEVLTLVEGQTPKPGPGQLLVRVRAAALNRADTLQRAGVYRPPPSCPSVLGVELAGEVAGLGQGVVGFRVGDPVMGLVSGGAYAEFCLLDACLAMPIPSRLSFAQAAAVPEAFFVANECLFHLGGLCPGESVLVHAASSGMGSVAVALAHVAGARVFYTVGSPSKAKKIASLGGDHPIFYKQEDFEVAVGKLTEGKGVDLVFDLLGGAAFAKNQRVMAFEARMVLVGLLDGFQGQIDVLDLVMRRLWVRGFSMRSRPLSEKAAIRDRFMARWYEPLTRGEIAPVVGATFPLAEAARAHSLMEAQGHFGKIVMTIPE